MSRYRSLWGTLAILGLMAVDAAFVMLIAEDLAALNWAAAAAVYAVAGTIWVLPAAYVTRWIARGRTPAG